jgi:hypothetical protein
MTSTGQKFMGFRKGLKAKKKKEEATEVEDIHKNIGYSEKLNAKVLSHLVCHTALQRYARPLKQLLKGAPRDAVRWRHWLGKGSGWDLNSTTSLLTSLLFG